MARCVFGQQGSALIDVVKDASGKDVARLQIEPNGLLLTEKELGRLRQHLYDVQELLRNRAYQAALKATHRDMFDEN